jgi:hypothetical protein
MSTRAVVVCVSLFAFAAAVPAEAQYTYRPLGNRATGENYHVEIAGNLWYPSPGILINSESIEGVPGSDIDFVDDLGIQKSWFTQLKVVLRPGTKHKFRFEYTPIGYDSETTLERNIVFNGILYRISLPIESEIKWRAYRFAYEWDFVYRDRGFVGLVLEAKYTDVEATLINRENSEFIRAHAPIPAIGVIGRGYVAPNIAITGEFTFFKVPDVSEDYGGRYFDFDLYGTVNFNDYVGVQAGFRSFDVVYQVEADNGDLTIKGLYFGGVVRF